MSVVTDIEVSEEAPLLHFPVGIPGFPEAHQFALVDAFGPTSPFALLRSVDDPDLVFVVTHSAPFFPDYEIDVDDAYVEGIGLESADDAIILLIVTIGDSLEESTANLLGPIVINQRRNEAIQVVLSDPKYGTKVPLLAS